MREFLLAISFAAIVVAGVLFLAAPSGRPPVPSSTSVAVNTAAPRARGGRPDRARASAAQPQHTHAGGVPPGAKSAPAPPTPPAAPAERQVVAAAAPPTQASPSGAAAQGGDPQNGR